MAAQTRRKCLTGEEVMAVLRQNESLGLGTCQLRPGTMRAGEEVMAVLQKGSDNRRLGETNMNKESPAAATRSSPAPWRLSRARTRG